MTLSNMYRIINLTVTIKKKGEKGIVSISLAVAVLGTHFGISERTSPKYEVLVCHSSKALLR